MLRGFLQNTAISAVAYALAGVLGLLAVGVIARSYGVAALGIIVLARAFLPTGFLALVDFGVSETTTQTVVRGRVGDWKLASEKVSLLTVITAITGVVSALVLFVAAAPLARIFKVAPDQIGSFVSIIKITALVLPIMFLGLIAEGALKGFEQYGWLRATEVSGNALYVVAVYVLIWLGASFEWVAYSYLLVMLVKYVVLGAAVWRAARDSPLRLCSWQASSRQDVVHRCWLMFNSRIVGTLQQPVVPLMIGTFYSPVEVGTYDLITRLPRFLKSIMAPLYSAILPVATRIAEETDTRRLRMLGRNGLVLPTAIVVPILVVFALFSKQILQVWVGSQYVDLWPWLALSTFIPAVTVMLGAGQAALMVRSDFLRWNTRLLYLQVITQYVVTALALYWFHEKAFILGWVVSFIVFGPLAAFRVLWHMGLPNSLLWKLLGKHFLVASILGIIVTACNLFFNPGSVTALIVVGGFVCLIAWILSGAIILQSGDRAIFGRFARAMSPRS